MNLSRLEQRTMREEGFREKPYKDTAGVWTIGYGSTYLHTQPVTSDTPALTPIEARTFLRAGLYNAALEAQRIIPRWGQFSYVRQEVFTEMCYQLGARGLAGFKNMIQACREYDIPGIVRHGKDSAWFRNRPGGPRPQRMMAAMESNRWEESHS